MKKDKILIPIPTCNQCNKLAPIDKQKSNNNWTVYKVKEPCVCGGKFEIRL